MLTKDEIKYLIDIPTDDSQVQTLLHLAAQTGNLDIVKILIHQAGARADVYDYYNGKPSSYAAQENHKKVQQYIASYDKSATTQQGSQNYLLLTFPIAIYLISAL